VTADGVSNVAAISGSPEKGTRIESSTAVSTQSAPAKEIPISEFLCGFAALRENQNRNHKPGHNIYRIHPMI
jgi:hypothetical protein